MRQTQRVPRSRVVPSRVIALTVVSSILLNGCATYERSQEQVDRTIDDWRWQRPPVTRIGTHTAETASLPADDPEPIVDRPLDDYIRTALERNPGIQSAMSDARAKLERIPQVTSLPDPMIRAVVRPEPIQTAAGDMYFTLGVSQTFPALAKLERAGNIAAAETRMALEQLNSKRIELITEVERAYWQIYRIDRSQEITRGNRRVLEDLERVVNTQYQVGRVEQQDWLRVQTELAELRVEDENYDLHRASAAAALNQLMDYSPDREIPATEPANAPAASLDVDTLIELASTHNPDLAGLREKIARDRETVELANLGYWPDLTVGFEWNYLRGRDAFMPPINPSTGMRPAINRMSEEGDDNWAMTVQMNIPLWAQRVEAAKREARHQLMSTNHDLRSAENRITFRIYDAWSRVEAQQRTLRVLDSELIPQARQTYEVTLTSYQSGKSDFTSLIEDWRRRLDFELMQHRETVDLQMALTDLRRAVGLQLFSDDTTESYTNEDSQDDS